ncbi:MAG: hypothetical protein ABW065_07190 [Solirubrobacterales bacterium]
MFAYDASEWTDFFVAVAGASAALAGLVFVAVSINIDRILKFKGLPERALETVLLLMTVLLVSLAGLIPGQSATALGVELLLLALALGAGVARLPLGSGDPDAAPGRRRSRWVIRAIVVLPLLLGGITVIAEAGGGLYWVVASIALGIVGAITNAWVLLVEILR